MGPHSTPQSSAPDAWPALSFEAWKDTYATLHRWTQIIGKTRMGFEPMLNHWWQVPLYVSARGLTTSAMPCGPGRLVDIEFDFIAHELAIRTSDGARRELPLMPRSVADFLAAYEGALRSLDVEAHVWPVPVELPDALPFAEDREHCSYDGESAHRFWQALIRIDRIFKIFRARFLGKSSPVHFFWGSFDLAVTRFSGRTAPPHPGGAPHVGDWVMREAYSHEVSSAGFWPGNDAYPQAAFYSYAYPTPEGFGDAPLRPADAFFSKEMGEFLLPYEAVRTAADPEAALLDFLQSTYEAAADRAGWDRVGLERGAEEQGALEQGA
jgi:hypothetical protein